MSSQWRNENAVHRWVIPKSYAACISKKYDKIQEQLQTISCLDELLSGKFIH